MTRTRDWRPGDWLVKDDESGFTLYASETVRRWDGMIVRKDQDEPPHPQWFIRARDDPRPVPFVRARALAGRVCQTASPLMPGTSVRRPVGAASHLLIADSISEMEIGCSFTVKSEGSG